jgi:hypothetical protein
MNITFEMAALKKGTMWKTGTHACLLMCRMSCQTQQPTAAVLTDEVVFMTAAASELGASRVSRSRRDKPTQSTRCTIRWRCQVYGQPTRKPFAWPYSNSLTHICKPTSSLKLKPFGLRKQTHISCE